MVRVLIAEDSPTTQLALQQIFSSDPEISIVGVANNGQEAINLTQSLSPDLITMDLQMPVLNGVRAIEEIMCENPCPIVILSGCWQTGSAEMEMEALSAEALTLVRKPPGIRSLEFDVVAAELIETIKAMAELSVVRRRPSRAVQDKPTPVPPPRIPVPEKPFKVVTIVTSTGGPPALKEVLKELPADFPIPILVVQHIAIGFISGMVDWLNSSVPLKVCLAEDNQSPQPGTVYLAPDNLHLGVSSQGLLKLGQGEKISGFRPAGTHLFRTAASYYGKQTLALIMTGMGIDGVAGLQDVRDAGGYILAQDEATSTVFGMPGAAEELGLVDQLLSLKQLSQYLKNLPS